MSIRILLGKEFIKDEGRSRRLDDRDQSAATAKARVCDVIERRDSVHEIFHEPHVDPESEEEVKRMNFAIVDALNANDFSGPAWNPFTPNFVCTFDQEGEHLSRDEMLAVLRRRVGPVVKIKAESWTFQIQAKPNGRAHCNAIMDAEIMHSPSFNLRTKGLAMYSWRRRNGRWLCYRIVYMKNLCDTVRVFC